MMKAQLKSNYDPNLILTLSPNQGGGELILGRGKYHIDQSKISTKQLAVQAQSDSITVQCLGKNPVLIKRGSDNLLVKTNEVLPLADADEIFLVPGSKFSFTISFKKSKKKEQTAPPSNLSKIRDSEKTIVMGEEEMQVIQETKKKLATSQKAPVSPPPANDSPASPSIANNDLTPLNQLPICKYGAQCYNQAKDHIKKFRHPCKYGAECYQKGADHLKYFFHPTKAVKESDSKTENENAKKKNPNLNTNPTVHTTPKLHPNPEDHDEDEEIMAGPSIESPENSDNEDQQARDNEDQQARDSTLEKGKKKYPVSLLLAEKFDTADDPTGWWMSEKLDGVRAFYNHKEKKLISRLGNAFVIPPNFTTDFPDFDLDGELWIGRKLFQRTVAIVRSKDAKSKLWEDITYQVFDAPSISAPFEERIKKLKTFFGKKDLPFINIVSHEKCKGANHLRSRLREVETEGGEGLMLRQPKSTYIPGRNFTLLKVKSFFDSEAKVVGYEKGKGKNADVVGALFCQLGNGTKFAVGSGMTDKIRANPPKIGAIITFRYQEISNAGVPRFPIFICERHDAQWPPDPKTQPQALTPIMKPPTKKKIKTEKEDPEPEGAVVTGPSAVDWHEKLQGDESNYPQIWVGMTFTFSGTLSLVRKEWVNVVQKHGGFAHEKAVSKGVTFLISTELEVETGTNKVRKAKKYQIPILSEEYMQDCIAQGKRLNHKKYIIG